MGSSVAKATEGAGGRSKGPQQRRNRERGDVDSPLCRAPPSGLAARVRPLEAAGIGLGHAIDRGLGRQILAWCRRKTHVARPSTPRRWRCTSPCQPALPPRRCRAIRRPWSRRRGHRPRVVVPETVATGLEDAEVEKAAEPPSVHALALAVIVGGRPKHRLTAPPCVGRSISVSDIEALLAAVGADIGPRPWPPEVAIACKSEMLSTPEKADRQTGSAWPGSPSSLRFTATLPGVDLHALARNSCVTVPVDRGVDRTRAIRRFRRGRHRSARGRLSSAPLASTTSAARAPNRCRSGWEGVVRAPAPAMGFDVAGDLCRGASRFEHADEPKLRTVQRVGDSVVIACRPWS